LQILEGKNSGSPADYSPQQWNVMEGVDRLADECGISSSQFALAWCLCHPDITCPIIGPRTVAQLEDNMAAVDVRLSTDVRQEVDQLSPPGQTCA
jgi:aryl-alcohol dehydrogenase-like predicted oxidoreductase